MKEAPVTGPLWDVARTLRARVRGFFDAPPGAGAAPLELLHAALDELEGKVQPSGRGSRLFPYTRVVVHVTQPAADRAAIEAVFGLLDARLRERLTELRCEIPASLTTLVSVIDSSNGHDPLLRVECSNGGDASSGTRVGREMPALRVHVLKGQCDHADYTFTGGVVSIGRGAELSDAFGRVRRNHVVFLDVRDGVTETVARAHARLELDPDLGTYLLFNESSTNPTFLLRGGRSMRVTPRDRRGVRVGPGDEIQLGRAVIKLAVADPGA
jgi:FHA domain